MSLVDLLMMGTSIIWRYSSSSVSINAYPNEAGHLASEDKLAEPSILSRNPLQTRCGSLA